MEEFKNIIFALNGPSAGGKSMVMDSILSNPAINVERLVAIATRPMRSTPVQEVEGVDYYFITKDEFLEKKRLTAEAIKRGNSYKDAIVEEAEYPENSGVIYGFYDSEIKRVAEKGKDAIAVLNLHGINEMKRFYGDRNVISIFIYRDLGDILKALQERKLSDKEITKRLNYAKQELLNMACADHVVYNISDKESLVDSIVDIIKNERENKRRN